MTDAFLIDTLPHTQKEKCHKCDIDQVISEQTHQKGLKNPPLILLVDQNATNTVYYRIVSSWKGR